MQIATNKTKENKKTKTKTKRRKVHEFEQSFTAFYHLSHQGECTASD